MLNITASYKIYNIIEIFYNLKRAHINLQLVYKRKMSRSGPVLIHNHHKKSYNSEKIKVTRRRKKKKQFDHTTIAVRLTSITVILSDNSHITGVDNRLTGQASPLPKVVLSKGYTDNFCICMYIHAVTSPLVLPFNGRPISVTCNVSSSFALFRSHTLRFCFTRYFFVSRTVKQRHLRYDSYIVRMTSRDVTLIRNANALCGFTRCTRHALGDIFIARTMTPTFFGIICSTQTSVFTMRLLTTL